VSEIKRRWRDYKTASGQRPVKRFLMLAEERLKDWEARGGAEQ
jgi:hypothetical protein